MLLKLFVRCVFTKLIENREYKFYLIFCRVYDFFGFRSLFVNFFRVKGSYNLVFFMKFFSTISFLFDVDFRGIVGGIEGNKMLFYIF